MVVPQSISGTLDLRFGPTHRSSDKPGGSRPSSLFCFSSLVRVSARHETWIRKGWFRKHLFALLWAFFYFSLKLNLWTNQRFKNVRHVRWCHNFNQTLLIAIQFQSFWARLKIAPRSVEPSIVLFVFLTGEHVCTCTAKKDANGTLAYPLTTRQTWLVFVKQQFTQTLFNLIYLTSSSKLTRLQGKC